VTGLETAPRRREIRRRRWPAALALVAAAIAILVVGIAIGQALADRPAPGGTQTLVRTLEPLPQQAP
jgi:hypothetical protein